MSRYLEIGFLLVIAAFSQQSFAQQLEETPSLCKKVTRLDGQRVDYRWCFPANMKPKWWCEETRLEQVKTETRSFNRYGSLNGAVWKCNVTVATGVNISVSDCQPPAGSGSTGNTLPSVPVNSQFNSNTPEENITAKVGISNPGQQWHGEGARFEVLGLQKVPNGCASSIKYAFKMDEKRERGSTISSYAYMSGGTVGGEKQSNFEVGIGNRQSVIVQNPSKTGGYSSYYGVGAVEGFNKTTVEAGFTQAGHIFTKFDGGGYEASASSGEDPSKFDTYNNYQFKTLYMGIAYQNNGTPELKPGEYFLGVLDENATQVIDCPGKEKVEVRVLLSPKNRLTSIDQFSQIHRFKRANGEVSYAVVVAPTEEKRKELLDKYRRVQAEGN